MSEVRSAAILAIAITQIRTADATRIQQTATDRILAHSYALAYSLSTTTGVGVSPRALLLEIVDVFPDDDEWNAEVFPMIVGALAEIPDPDPERGLCACGRELGALSTMCDRCDSIREDTRADGDPPTPRDEED